MDVGTLEFTNESEVWQNIRPRPVEFYMVKNYIFMEESLVTRLIVGTSILMTLTITMVMTVAFSPVHMALHYVLLNRL